MAWYYVRDNQRVGPVSEENFQLLAKDGVIRPQTLVWQQGMAQWQPYAAVQGGGTVPVAPLAAPSQAFQPSGQCLCVECGRPFPSDEMVPYQDVWVCAACKPVFFQRVREGAAIPRQMNYAGFWIRLAAHFIDGLITGGVFFVIMIAMLLPAIQSNSQEAIERMSMMMNVFQLLGFVAGIAYETILVGAYGGTLGKLALGLRVVASDGGRVTYLRAFGRYFAKILSGILFCVGYVMVAFDDEKRGLHDRICDTRVVSK